MASALGDIFDDQVSWLDVEVWIEPFAGGAGAGLALLDSHRVEEVWLTEKHPALAALWRTILQRGDDLAARVAATTPDMALWEQSRETVAAALAGDRSDDLELGFAALVINRCSRSGIVSPTAGPIGGKAQAGEWTIASRFNAEGLADRIRHVASMAPRIRFTEGDALDAITDLDGSGIEDEVFLFVDPPYIREGNRLYANGMTEADHAALARALNSCPARWLLTYDDEPVVAEVLYPDRHVLAYEIRNTANQHRTAVEYAVFSDNLAVRQLPTLLPKGQTHWVQKGAPLRRHIELAAA